MEYDIKPKNLTRQEKGFPATIQQLIQKYKLDALWENIEKSIKDIIKQELGEKAIKGTSLTVKGLNGEGGFIQVLNSEDKPVIGIGEKGVELREGTKIIEGEKEIGEVTWNDIKDKPECIVQKDFVVFTGVFKNMVSINRLQENLNYPEGFNKDNCIVISLSIDDGVYFPEGIQCELLSDAILLVYNCINADEVLNTNYKLVIMKIL